MVVVFVPPPPPKVVGGAVNRTVELPAPGAAPRLVPRARSVAPPPATRLSAANVSAEPAVPGVRVRVSKPDRFSGPAAWAVAVAALPVSVTVPAFRFTGG